MTHPIIQIVQSSKLKLKEISSSRSKKCHEYLENEITLNCVKFQRKEGKQFAKILIIKQKKNQVKMIEKKRTICESLDDKVREKVCGVPKKRMKVFRENLDKEVKERLYKSGQ